MIRRIDIRNFKKFKQLRFDAPPFSVIAGPNNSGKTSLLQAVAAWSEIGYRWRKKWRGGAPDLARNGGAYPTVESTRPISGRRRLRGLPRCGWTKSWKIPQPYT